MKKTSLLFLTILAILTLLLVAGFVFLPKERSMPEIQNSPPSPSQINQGVPLPTLTPTVQPSPDLTANWKIYRNEKYGFEVRYPDTYMLRNRDVRRALTQSRSIILNKEGDDIRLSILIEVLLPGEERAVQFHLGATDREYVNYIKSPDQYAKKDTITLDGKEASVFFFDKENPGELGDFRDTVVVLIEQRIILIIKMTPASEIDAEFKNILSTLTIY